VPSPFWVPIIKTNGRFLWGFSKCGEDRTNLSGFQDKCSLVSYIPEKGKFILLILTLHNGDKISSSIGDRRKSKIVTFYDMTKGGVIVVEEI
jgi:hypothetical protein